MIKNYIPQPYEGGNPLPAYVDSVNEFELIGTAPSGYKVTLARLAVGESKSAGNPLSHALFESYTDHGERARVARTRVSGYDREFVAVRSAMAEAGVEFHPMLPCTCEELLGKLGDWFAVQNPELTEVSVVVSQKCH